LATNRPGFKKACGSALARRFTLSQNGYGTSTDAFQPVFMSFQRNIELSRTFFFFKKEMLWPQIVQASKKACDCALARRFTLSQNGYGTCANAFQRHKPSLAVFFNYKRMTYSTHLRILWTKTAKDSFGRVSYYVCVESVGNRADAGCRSHKFSKMHTLLGF